MTKILAIDYGKKKIGVALGDTITKLVEPLQVLPITNYELIIINYIRENNVEKIIVGLPNGTLDEEIKKFGEGVASDTGLPVEYVDETLSSQEALSLMRETGKNRKSLKKEDAIAAAIMLQSYMEVEKNV